MNPRFALSFAARSLARDRQRSIQAIGCVAMGVMSLVGLQQLSHIVGDVLLLPPPLQESADLLLTRPGRIEDEHLARLGDCGVDDYGRVAVIRTMLMKAQDAPATTIVSSALGLDPSDPAQWDGFVLEGAPNVQAALAQPRGALLTRDLARRLELAPGDEFLLFGAPDAAPARLRVAAVVLQAANRRGMALYTSLDTAAELALAETNQLRVRHGAAETLVPCLEAAGWNAQLVPRQADEAAAQLFAFMLAGAGMLGLLLAGIGVAHTMQVVLARRRLEIATLKVLGYGRTQLLVLLGSECALLGLIASTIGIALGLLLAAALTRLLSDQVSFLLRFSVQPHTLIAALAIGSCTTLLFAGAAILQASETRPALLLRDAPLALRDRRRGATWLSHAILLALFAALSSAVLGSLAKGFGVVAAGLAALALVGLFLWAMLRLLLRLPSGDSPLLRLALRNLRHAPLRAVQGWIALFVGVLAIGIAIVVLFSARDRLGENALDPDAVNLRVYAQGSARTRLSAALAAAGAKASYAEFGAPLTVHADSLRAPIAQVVGRPPAQLRWNLKLVDSLALAPPQCFLEQALAARSGVGVGDSLWLEGTRGQLGLRIDAIYRRGGSSLDLGAPPAALIVPQALVDSLAGPVELPMQLQVVAAAADLARIRAAVGAAAPDAVAVGTDTIQDLLQRLFVGLFWFASAVASLALLAGAVLIANSVGLSMLERRRELGILKALGYDSVRLLTTVLLENGLGGLLAGACAVGVLWIALPLLNAAAPAAELSLRPLQGALLVLAALGCATCSALLAAWGAAHARPLSVLREA